MIITVTMNPAIDKTCRLDKITSGGLNRLESVRRDVGGKGVNVAKMVKALGGDAICTGFAGENDEFIRLFDLTSLRRDFIETKGSVRTNLKITDSNGYLTEFNEPGIEVTDADIETLKNRITDISKEGDIITLCGSLPRGARPDIYKDLCLSLQRGGRKVFADTSGTALKEVITALPYALKPNIHELSQIYGAGAELSLNEAVALCRKIISDGVKLIALSMGEKGAMFFTKDRAVSAEAVKVTVLSPVGAGDSMVGALAYADERKLPFEECVRISMAASVGAVTTAGTNPPSKELVSELESKIIIKVI